MSSYAAILSANFRILLQYRAAAIAGLATQLFWGLIRVMIFEAFYRSTTADQPMNLDQVTTYIWLGQAFIMLLPWNLDRQIHALIRSGYGRVRVAPPRGSLQSMVRLAPWHFAPRRPCSVRSQSLP